MNIRRLPDYVGVAATMSDFFGPDDCNAGEILVRRGLMQTHTEGPRDCVMAYSSDIGMSSLRVVVNYEKGWECSIGSRPCSEDVIRCISDIIKCGCP